MAGQDQVNLLRQGSNVWQPLIVDGRAIERHEYAMFEDLRRRYHWVLPTSRYQDTSDLLESIQEYVIEPAQQKAKELAMQ